MTDKARPQGQQRVKGRRRIRHVVLVTDEQEAQLTTLARARNLTVARLLVDTTLGAPQLDNRAVMHELSGIRRILTGEATNLNQIAKAANSGAFDEQAFDDALRTIAARGTALVTLFATASPPP